MIFEERRRQIHQWVESEGSVSIDTLAKRFGVSAMTVWRDLKSLESKGKIKRVHGGAVSLELEDSFEAHFATKQSLHGQEKDTIAHCAASKYIETGDIIILEGGTTVAKIIQYLDKPRLTLLTNGLDILNIAANSRAKPTIMCCGGILRERSHTFVGPQAEAFFGNFRAHRFFMSATGLTLEEGPTDPNLLEIQIKRAMASCAKQTILLVDSSKFGVHSLSNILPLEEVDVLITDKDAPQDILDSLKQKGIEIHIADRV